MTDQTLPSILIVDDDENICKTLSAIIEAEGYQTTIAINAKEAIEKTKTQFFNMALLDIKLIDMEGTQLLEQLQESAPETIKIMITGYPSPKNAVESLNLGAASYIMKPIDPAELLKTIRKELETQKETEEITKEKLVKWVKSQTRRIQSTSFENFLEETSKELTNFDLTKTQAKIYITLVALGIASASQVATLSKIRREEVYRMIPELEKQGIITGKLGAPRKFSATKPEIALKILAKDKLKTMKEEIDKLGQTQANLVAKLKAIELPTPQNTCSIEVILKRENAFVKLTKMAQNAKQQIDMIAPIENLTTAYMNCQRIIMEQTLKSIKIRIITKKRELDAVTEEIIQFSEVNNNIIKLKKLEKLPFNMFTVDDKEALWGEIQPNNENTPIYWTNDPTQITILKTAFETLWKKATQFSHSS